jgi:hypothetical protein
MDDFLILYSGMFCFGMIGLGVALTIYEFKKMSRPIEQSIRKTAQPKPGLVTEAEPFKGAA